MLSVLLSIAVISGSKIKILKVNHNCEVLPEYRFIAVISGSKIKILKVNHNEFEVIIPDAVAVISGSKIKILKVNHNLLHNVQENFELLSLAQR